jgi:hypothetical protein
MDDWYRRDSFTIGAVYFDADGLSQLEYVGTVTARVSRHLLGDRADEVHTANDVEAVMMFRVVDDDAAATASSDDEVMYYTHSRSDADRGYHFIKVRDASTDASANRSRYAG